MTAYDESMAALVNRLDGLEADLAASESRIRTLEVVEPKAGPDVIIEIYKRLEALELNQSAAFAASKITLEKHEERQRVCRWHATRDAALPEAMRMLVGLNDDHEAANRAHSIAAIHADRAHGPLVATERSWVEKFSEEYVNHVNALVKAAKRARNNLRHRDRPGEANDLDGALKPFGWHK